MLHKSQPISPLPAFFSKRACPYLRCSCQSEACSCIETHALIFPSPCPTSCFFSSLQGGERDNDGPVAGGQARGRGGARAGRREVLPHGGLLHLLPPVLRRPGHELVSFACHVLLACFYAPQSRESQPGPQNLMKVVFWSRARC